MLRRLQQMLAARAALGYTAPAQPASPSPGKQRRESVLSRLSPEDQARAQELIAELRAAFAGKRSPRRRSTDPQTVALQVGFRHIKARATRTFAVWAKAVVAEMGDSIKPHLKWIYMSIRHWPGIDTTGMDKASEIEDLTDAQVEAMLAEAAAPTSTSMPRHHKDRASRASRRRRCHRPGCRP